MKTRPSDTLIHLKELPADGRDFDFTRASGELNQALKDLVNTNDYHFKIRLTPQGNTFELRGEIQTALNLQCSVCGTDFTQPVVSKLHEIIVIEPSMHKGDQQTRANHAHEWQGEGPDYMVLENDVLNLGDYAHEMVALSEPIRPLCAPEAASGCANPGLRVERPWLTYGAENEPSIRQNPFEVLQKLKLKS